MTAYIAASDENQAATQDFVWIHADDTTDRRSRAGQIGAERRRFELAHNVRLELLAKSYDEAPGFLHRSAFRFRITRLPEEAGKIVVTTNHVPRDLIDAWELTEAERAEFDYLDWDAIEDGRDSAEFFRYRGQLYALHEFSSDWGITRGTGLPHWLDRWHGHMSDSFFSGMVIRFPVDQDNPVSYRSGDVNYDYERIVVGTFYVRG